MSPCEIIMVIFGAWLLMTGMAALAMFVGASSIWNVHKMLKFARSVGGKLVLLKGTYTDSEYYKVEMPNGTHMEIPSHVSKHTTIYHFF